MGTLTANTPELPDHCAHKLPTSCRLTATPKCCACQDKRPQAPTYSVYIDGVGMVNRGTRWQRYCWFCKEFWENRVKRTNPPMEPRETRVPNDPDQTDFVREWFQYYKGYKIEYDGEGSTEVRTLMLPQKPWLDTAPGTLPVIEDDPNFGQATFRPRHTPSVDVEQVSLEDTLDQLLAEADEQSPAGPIATSASSFDARNAVSTDLRQTTDRLRETRDQITIAERRRRDIQGQLQETVLELRELRERQARVSREQRTAHAFARVFGTREDMQRADYVSPLASMFGRAFERYRIAEEVRAEERASDRNEQRYQELIERFQVPNFQAMTANRPPESEQLPVQTLDDEQRPPPMTDEQLTMKLECKICLQQLADTAVLPCGHLMMCSHCASIAIPTKLDDPLQPLRRSSQCPLCRKPVKRLAKIVIP